MGDPSPLPTPGWYPDPATGQQRYWDGAQWGPFAPPPPPQFAPPAPAGVVVTGPNHALHAILSILTFWMCGGWIWIWLLVAIFDQKTVRTVDAYGRPIMAPRPPRQNSSIAAQIGRLADEAGGAMTDSEGHPRWGRIALAIAVTVVALVALLAMVVAVF